MSQHRNLVVLFSLLLLGGISTAHAQSFATFVSKADGQTQKFKNARNTITEPTSGVVYSAGLNGTSIEWRLGVDSPDGVNCEPTHVRVTGNGMHEVSLDLPTPNSADVCNSLLVADAVVTKSSQTFSVQTTYVDSSGSDVLDKRRVRVNAVMIDPQNTQGGNISSVSASGSDSQTVTANKSFNTIQMRFELRDASGAVLTDVVVSPNQFSQTVSASFDNSYFCHPNKNKVTVSEVVVIERAIFVPSAGIQELTRARYDVTCSSAAFSVE